jgi:hypothetical protein
MQWSTSGVVSTIDINPFLRTPILDMLEITINDSLTKSCSITDISHGGPFLVGDGVEASNFLSSWIIHNKLELARNISLALLLSHFNFFIGLWDWTISTTILEDFLGTAEEAWMPMKVYFAIIRLIPLSIQKEILSIEQTIDLRRVVLWS